MFKKRTDLAVEAKEIWDESTGAKTELPGVKAVDETVRNFKVTTVDILDERGEKELCKPKGTYITVELDSLIKREDDAFNRGAETLAEELTKLLKIGDDDTILVVGLGNAAVTPDAIGPKTVKSTMITRHLVDTIPEYFSQLRKVSAIETGVLATTGIESAELIKAVTEKIKPDMVIVIDALASRKLSRVCRTVQLADTGIVPGSGVGNSRAAINTETLGVKVIAIGVPTVVDAATLAADLTEEAGLGEFNPESFRDFAGDMIVTPKDIDASIADISKLIGYSINLALHKGLTIDDVNMFLS